MTEMTFVANLILVFQGVMLFIIPEIARPGIYFGVTVDPSFRATDAGRRIVRGYRLWIAIASVFAFVVLNAFPADVSSTDDILAILMGDAFEPRIHLSFILQAGIGITGWIRGNRQARHHAVPAVPVRTAALTSLDMTMPGGWLFFAGPVLIVAAATMLVYLNWEAIPERLPVHWDINGEPDRFADRSPGVVFRPLLVALFTDTWILIMAYYTLFRTRRISLDDSATVREWGFKRFSYLILLLAGYMTSLMSSALALSRIWADPGQQNFPVWVVLIAPVLIVAAVVFYAVRYGQGGIGRHAPAGAALGDRSPDECWKLGMFYYNPADPAFIVEKRMGFGWTFNFASKWAWLIVLLILTMPLFIRTLR